MTTCITSDTVYDVLLRNARAEILKEFRPDSCIASTAVVIDVLEHFGVSAKPLPVRVMIFNAAAIRCIEKYGMPHDGGETMIEWGNQYGAWGVGIGVTRSPMEECIGHLVALTEDQHVIDLSLDQADRPRYDMEFSPLKFAAAQLLSDGKQCVIHDNCALVYETINNHGYTQSTNWYKRSERKAIVDRLIARIEGKE